MDKREIMGFGCITKAITEQIMELDDEKLEVVLAILNNEFDDSWFQKTLEARD